MQTYDGFGKKQRKYDEPGNQAVGSEKKASCRQKDHRGDEVAGARD
jgi:hypothetical protein